jgi:hypothetical protein
MKCGHCHGDHETVAEVRACAGRLKGTPGPVGRRRTKRKLSRGSKIADTPSWIRYRQQMRETRRAESEDRDYTLNIPLSKGAHERMEEERARDRRLEPHGPPGHLLYIEQGPDNTHRGSPTHSQTWFGRCECGWSARAGSVDALWARHADHCASGA